MKRQSSSSPGTFFGKTKHTSQRGLLSALPWSPFPATRLFQKIFPPAPPPPKKLPKYCFFCFHFPEEIRSTMLRVFNFFRGGGGVE